jgi:hypothetical protein
VWNARGILGGRWLSKLNWKLLNECGADLVHWEGVG